MQDKSTDDILHHIIDGAQDRKGRGITVVDLSAIDTAAARRFIIVEGNSTTQTGAIAEGIDKKVRERTGIKPIGAIGLRNGDWIIMDYGDTWVHIFLPAVRTRFNLEELWGDASIINIPDLD